MNLLESIPAKILKEEQVDLLEQAGPLRIERIISTGQCSQAGFWYDQSQVEWVLVLQGEAELEWTDGTRKRLYAGDFLKLPAHQKHRVAWTSTTPACIWFCIFFSEKEDFKG